VILGVLNCDEMLMSEFTEKWDVKVMERGEPSSPDIDAIFIDWTAPSDKKEDVSLLVIQSSIVEDYKDVPIAIFDRHLSIKQDEFRYFLKRNVYLFEPALNYRTGFSYLPFWTKTKTVEDVSLDFFKTIDLAYRGKIDKNVDDFEKYYYKTSIINNYKVVYYSPVTEKMEKKYSEDSLVKDLFDWKDVKCSVLIDSPHAYKYGVLDQSVFEMVDNHCLPLLPRDHRWFTSLFKSVIVDNTDDVKKIIELYPHIFFGVIVEFYNTINNHFEEFRVEYTADTIGRCLWN